MYGSLYRHSLIAILSQTNNNYTFPFNGNGNALRSWSCSLWSSKYFETPSLCTVRRSGDSGRAAGRSDRLTGHWVYNKLYILENGLILQRLSNIISSTIMGKVQLVIDEALLKQTITVTGLIALKFFGCILFQGKARVYAGSRPPEDVALFPKAGAQNFDGQGKFKDEDEKGRKLKEAEARWLRLIQNDVENIPLGLVIAWGSLLCNPNSLVQQIGLWTFCVGRLGHSYAYANALQPSRAIFWFAGVVGMLTMVGNGVFAAWF